MRSDPDQKQKNRAIEARRKERTPKERTKGRQQRTMDHAFAPLGSRSARHPRLENRLGRDGRLFSLLLERNR